MGEGKDEYDQKNIGKIEVTFCEGKKGKGEDIMNLFSLKRALIFLSNGKSDIWVCFMFHSFIFLCSQF